MLLLEPQDYYKVLLPLSQVKINTLFAEAVLRRPISGKVYVDSLEDPRTFYIAHPYGMSLLFGRSDNEAFNRQLHSYIANHTGTRQAHEWLQADPERQWTDRIEIMITEHNGTAAGQLKPVIRHERVNFDFKPAAYQAARDKHAARFGARKDEIVRTTEELYAAQRGSVTPQFFWNSGGEFVAEGIGYTLLSGAEPAATAFSAFINEHQLELGIETAEEHRGQGYAFAVSSALIDYCLQQQLKPVWACRRSNEGSYNLATRLGFEPSLIIPYYQLT
ncbi:GNAT family N-acetyltransferase [Paenibacillus donghaensis]|uniref:N-acetyltransferase domain-containing protein n=1 Tax=Paenibacillus donghaensis TaxID=414771 RepID=A0A2Z2KT76_9BACL|nr:GNAT family N-acetyltransferase [Paenibacillus donghaensis]ASA22548.1 hypothetical protein B9T62_18225 [Paenibacillus donghaensis]